MIRAILFDFGQTLVDSSTGFRRAEKDAQKTLFADLGVKDWAAFLADYRRLRQAFHARSDFSRLALWTQVYRHFDREPSQPFLSAAEQAYWGTVKKHTQPFPDTRAVLARLAATHRLAMITNTQGQGTANTHRLALFPRIEGFFEVIIVAGEAGIPPKPNPLPFQTCLAQLAIAPHEAIFVGDDWRIDIRGAQAVGIHPVWLQHHSVSRNWPVVKTSVPIITCLEHLIELIQTFREKQ